MAFRDKPNLKDLFMRRIFTVVSFESVDGTGAFHEYRKILTVTYVCKNTPVTSHGYW